MHILLHLQISPTQPPNKQLTKMMHIFFYQILMFLLQLDIEIGT